MLSMGLPFSQIHKATDISMGTLSNMKNNPLVWGHAQWASLSHPHGGGGDHGQEVGNACGGAHGSGLDCVSLDRRGHCRKLKPLSCVKPVMERRCREDSEHLTEFNAAKYYERACKVLEEYARMFSKSIFTAGFKLASVAPFKTEATARAP